MNMNRMKEIDRLIAKDLIRISNETETPHLGSNLSTTSILTALYFRVMNVDLSDSKFPQRDRFYMSKGHASPAHYVALAHRGFFKREDLYSLSKDGSIFEEHSGIDKPVGVECINGSLGHALGIAAGSALAAQLRGETYQHFVLMGDGEINEGSVWEAAMFIPAKGLSRVTAIIDHNKWQATGRSQDIMGLNNIKGQFESFGWEAIEIDGHDINALVIALESSKSNAKPLAIIANTIKGKGVSFMEDDNNWHYRIPTDEEVKLAIEEIDSNA